MAVPADAPGRDDVAVLADIRDAIGPALAVAPIELRTTESTDVDPVHGLLSRMVGRNLRVLDLSASNEIGATVERNAASDRLSYSGRLDRMLWLADLAGARRVMISSPLEIRAVSRTSPRVLHFSDGAIKSYAAALAGWTDACQKASPALGEAREEGDRTWQAAEHKYKAAKPWWSFLASESEYKQARTANEDWQRELATARAHCTAAPIEPDVLQKQEGTRSDAAEKGSTFVAELRFRVVEVPGGRVLLSGRIEREDEQIAPVIDKVLDGVVAALMPKAGRR